MVTHSNWWI